MKVKICLTLLLFSLLCFVNLSHAQSKQDSLVNDALSFELKGDTLYASTGLKIYNGQKLTVGNSAREDGRFRSIVSSKAAIVPSIWGQDKRFDKAIENYVDSRKNREKLSHALIPGGTLTVQNIELSKTGRPHFYMVILSSDAVKCKADIGLALLLGELLR